MKQVEKIWSEMAAKKAELASQEVQLGDIKQIAKMTKQANAWESEINKYGFRMRELKEEIDREISEAQRDAKAADALVADLERALVTANAAAEELGINSDSIKELSQGMDAMGALIDELQELDARIKEVR
jgi:chromosome segregation ATPase